LTAHKFKLAQISYNEIICQQVIDSYFIMYWLRSWRERSYLEQTEYQISQKGSFELPELDDLNVKQRGVCVAHPLFIGTSKPDRTMKKQFPWIFLGNRATVIQQISHSDLASLFHKREGKPTIILSE